MLIDDIYRIGKEYNLKVKYNSKQGIPCIRKWICDNHIARLLESDLKLTDDKAILLEQSLGADLGIKTFYDELLICEK